MEEYSFVELADMQLVYGTFGEHCIGWSGPIAWLPRSPDLNPFDSCVWGYLKSLVCETSIVSEELDARILVAVDQLQLK